MRPGTVALPSAVAFSSACRSAAILGRPQPVKDRATGLLDRNRCKIGRQVDAAGDGRAPDAVAISTACRSAAILGRPQPVNNRAQDLHNRNGCKIGHRIDAAGDGRAPERRCLFQRVQERGDSSPHTTGQRSDDGFA